tara:strand:+ start:325 stop:651 length:327 start_codon:yes stop_codon:yes gene_type:complete
MGRKKGAGIAAVYNSLKKLTFTRYLFLGVFHKNYNSFCNNSLRRLYDPHLGLYDPVLTSRIKVLLCRCILRINLQCWLAGCVPINLLQPDLEWWALPIIQDWIRKNAF